MNHRRTMITKLSVAAVIAVGAITLLKSVNTHDRLSASPLFTAPTAQELGMALIRCGLYAKSLASAGLSTNSVTMLVNNVRSSLTDTAASLASADENCGTFRGQVDTLERKAQSGQASAQDLTNLATARANLASAQTSQQTALNTLFSAGTAGLNQTQSTVLTAIRANKSWDLPVQYLTVNRTQAQWVALREALANERIAEANGESASEAAQTLLTQVRADPTVAAATASVEANLATITAAWQQAVSQ